MKLVYQLLNWLGVLIVFGIPLLVFLHVTGFFSGEEVGPTSPTEIASNRLLAVACVCLAGLLVSINYLVRAWIISGQQVATVRRIMWNVLWRSSNGIKLSLMTTFVLGSSLALGEVFAPGNRGILVLISMLVTITSLLTLMAPPVAIVLGRSCQTAGDSVGSVTRFLAPYRVVSLLRKDSSSNTYHNEPFNQVRTQVHAKWQRQVTDLCSIAPLILVDTRGSSEPVEFEVSHILNQGLAGKTMMVADWQAGSGPVLDAQFVALKHAGSISISSQTFSDWLRFFHQRLNKLGYQLGNIERLNLGKLLSRREYLGFRGNFIDPEVEDREIREFP